MLRNSKYHDMPKKDLHRDEGRSRYPSSEWGRNSEFGKNSEFHEYRESDSRDRARPFDMDNYYSGRQFSVGGVDFERDFDEDEDWTSSRSDEGRSYNRSRFAEPYAGGQFSRSQYGVGGGFERDRWSPESRGYGMREDFSGLGPKGYRRSDERIKEEVCEALYASPFVDASDIEVSVNDGCVRLYGTVESRNAKREAETTIENLSGVTDIQNELRLKRTTDGESDLTRKSNRDSGSDHRTVN